MTHAPSPTVIPCSRRACALPCPTPIGDIDRVDMIELIDGYLVSFVTGLGSTDGPGSPMQATVHVSGEGRATPVGQRALPPGFSTRAAPLSVVGFAGDA